MAKSPAGADAIMSVPEIKQLLAKARRGDPVNCAIGLSKDKEAVLLLDRKKKPRKLMGDLKKKAAEAGLDVPGSLIRFGRAEIDGAEDARTVHFVVNKEAPGLFRTALTKMLRPAGVGHVEIGVDEGLEQESEDEGQEASPAPAPAAAAAPDVPDAAAPDPALGAALTAVGKSSQVWEATLKSVERQVSELHGKLTKAYQGHGFGAELDKVFHAKVEPMLESLDASLIAKLAEVSAGTDPAARSQAVAEAQQIIARYESYLAGEKLIAKLDSNPFVPLSIQKTLTASLEALNRSLGGVAAKLAA